MKLYQATNGAVGCSYVRSYVWARNANEATRLANEVFHNLGLRPTNGLTLLFDADVMTAPFATTPDDEGWLGLCPDHWRGD